MKGQTGTPMQSIIHIPQKKGNVFCKDCKYLQYRGGKISPYVCSLKNKPRHYTSRVFCKEKEVIG